MVVMKLVFLFLFYIRLSAAVPYILYHVYFRLTACIRLLCRWQTIKHNALDILLLIFSHTRLTNINLKQSNTPPIQHPLLQTGSHHCAFAETVYISKILDLPCFFFIWLTLNISLLLSHSDSSIQTIYQLIVSECYTNTVGERVFSLSGVKRCTCLQLQLTIMFYLSFSLFLTSTRDG